jgi:hypothetical protein
MPALRMTADPAGRAGEVVAYTFRPSLLGAPWEFKLTSDGIEWVAGRKSGRVALRDVRRLRMSFKPANMQSQRFVTEIWADAAPKLAIVSTSWKSMFEQERLDKSYAVFVGELHRRIARAGLPVRCERGGHPLLFWPGLAAFAAIVLASAVLIARAVQADAIGGAAFIGAFLALFLWQGGNFVLRNRPGLYRPDALPAQLMPKVYFRTTSTEHLA